MTRSALIALAVLGIAAVALAAYAHTARPIYSPSAWSAHTSCPCSCCPGCPIGAAPPTAAQTPASPMMPPAAPCRGTPATPYNMTWGRPMAPYWRTPPFYRYYRYYPTISMTEVKGTIESFQPPSILVVRTFNGTTVITRVPPAMVDEDARMTYMPLLLSKLATKGATVALLLFHPNTVYPAYIAAKITIGGHTYYAPQYVTYQLAQGNTP